MKPATIPQDPGRTEEQTAYRQMSGLLRQTATLLEQKAPDAPAGLSEDLARACRLLRDQLDTLLAPRPHAADRADRPGMDSPAHGWRHGATLSREELLARYSEFAQEIAQPLTISTGALELLLSGQTGSLPAHQRELLEMTAEGIARLNTLVEHLNAISGVPASLAPDARLLEQAYRK
jgi:signal transduction histidine kinase